MIRIEAMRIVGVIPVKDALWTNNFMTNRKADQRIAW